MQQEGIFFGNTLGTRFGRPAKNLQAFAKTPQDLHHGDRHGHALPFHSAQSMDAERKAEEKNTFESMLLGIERTPLLA